MNHFLTVAGVARSRARSPVRIATPRDKSPARDEQITVSVDGFRRILRALRVAAHETQLSAGLSAAQLFVLWAIAESSESSVNALAELTMTDRSSVAALLDRLVAHGLAVRQRSATDRRKAEVSITTAGRAALRRAPQPPTALLVAGLRALPRPELARLARSITELTVQMGLTHEPAQMLFDDRPPPRRKDSSH